MKKRNKKKQFLIVFLVLLLPCMGVSKCKSFDEEIADQQAEILTLEAETNLEVEHELEQTAQAEATQTAAAVPTLTNTPEPSAELPEGVTWEDLAGAHLPPPPSGVVSDQSTCESTKRVQVDALKEADYEVYKKTIEDSGWEPSGEIPDFDPETQDVAAYARENDALKLDYDRQTATLFIQRGTSLGTADTLVIMGDRAWTDIMDASVPPPANGRVTSFQQTSNGEETTAWLVTLEGVNEETLQKWIDDFTISGWTQQSADFQTTFEQKEEDYFPPGDSTSTTSSEETSTYYFLYSQTNALAEIMYTTNQLILTWLLP